jgi:hypothetical protein
VIDTRAGAATLTAWQPQRSLRLLDLSGMWLLRNPASAALLAAPRSICRRWARAIYTAWPELDGLSVPSTLTGRPHCAVERCRGLDTHDAVVLAPTRVVNRASGSRRDRLPHPVTSPQKVIAVIPGEEDRVLTGTQDEHDGGVDGEHVRL